MKKFAMIFCVVFFVAIVSSGLYAQDRRSGSSGGSSSGMNFTAYPDVLSEGNILVSAGIGIGNTLAAGEIDIPPIYAAIDYAKPLGGIPLTLGVQGVYATSNAVLMPATAWYDEITMTLTAIGVAGRVCYHPSLGFANLDPYAVFGVGYMTYQVAIDAEDESLWESPDYSGTFWYLGVGARYFFTPNIGAFAEIDYNNTSTLTLGLTVKF